MTSTTEAQPATITTERTAEILTAVDRLIRVHDEWERDDKAPLQPSEAFEIALSEAVTACDSGDTPMRCRELVTAMSRLGFEWNQYVDGRMDAQHRPLGSFWAAFRGVIKERGGAVCVQRRALEPVAELLKQGVSYNQIACHIYGHHGQGPFLTANGQPDVAKILQERDKPGSILGPDWIHPEDAELSRQAAPLLRRSLNAVARRDADSPAPTPDPATIEQLLREGQFPDVIARVKLTTLAEVLEVAEQCGITPNQRPNLSDKSANFDPTASATEDKGPTVTTPAAVEADIRSAIEEAYGPNADANAVAERLQVSAQKVRGIWMAMRRKPPKNNSSISLAQSEESGIADPDDEDDDGEESDDE